VQAPEQGRTKMAPWRIKTSYINITPKTWAS